MGSVLFDEMNCFMHHLVKAESKLSRSDKTTQMKEVSKKKRDLFHSRNIKKPPLDTLLGG